VIHMYIMGLNETG